MSLSKAITIKSIDKQQENLTKIILTLTITDTLGTGFNEDYLIEWRKGENIEDKINDITNQMQISVDKYKNEDVILKSAGLTNAVNSILGGIVL